MSENLLLSKILDFKLDLPDATFNFSDRLCRENGWSLKYAIQAIQEYKKFMYLLILSSEPLTPSDQVDQVWHLHLLYTKSYWEEFCKKTLGKEIHHGPTKGGQEERSKYILLYNNTLKLYQEVFKELPPTHIWPHSEVRFADIDFVRVNRKKHFIVPKPSFLHNV